MNTSYHELKSRADIEGLSGSHFICKTCNKPFYVQPCRSKLGMVKYCSMRCYIKRGEKNPFWGKTHKQKSINKMLANPNRSSFKEGKDNPAWKEKLTSYTGVHNYVINTFGKPDTCESCNKGGLSGHKIHWANVSGKYLKDRADWKRLCVPCHKRFDKQNNTHPIRARAQIHAR